MKKLLGYAAPAIVTMAMACGAGTPKPTEPEAEPTATTKPVETPPPAKSADPVALAADAGAEGDAAVVDAAIKPRTGGVMATYVDQLQPTTTGYSGAVFRITASGAELRVPNGSLSDQRNIIFWINKKGHSTKGKVGEIYELRAQVPEKEYYGGQDNPSQPLPTAGDPFVVKLPLPAGQNTANLAVERVQEDARTKRAKSVWVIVPMLRMETADPANRAVFELNTIPDGNIHLTTEAAAPAPTAAPVQ